MIMRPLICDGPSTVDLAVGRQTQPAPAGVWYRSYFKSYETARPSPRKRALEIEKRVMIFAYDARCVIDQAEGPELSLWRGRDLCPMNVDGRLD